MSSNAGAITVKRILSCKDFADIYNTIEHAEVIRSYAHPLLGHCRFREGVKFLKISSTKINYIEPHVDIKGYNDELSNELKILSLLKKKILDTKISPCIVDLEGSCVYTDITKILADLNVDCGRIGRRFRSNNPQTARDWLTWSLCEWQYQAAQGGARDQVTVELMERCDDTFVRYCIGYHDTYVEFMVIKSILFMVLYTFYQIHKLYPKFQHLDLHTENIMIKVDHNFVFDPSKPKFLVFTDDVLGKFTLPYYGVIPKIIDFAFAVIPEENIYPIINLDKVFMGSRFKSDFNSILWNIYEDGLGHHRRVANLLSVLDPQQVYAEAIWVASTKENPTAFVDALKSSAWKEFRNVEIEPSQIHEEYNSPPRK